MKKYFSNTLKTIALALMMVVSPQSFAVDVEVPAGCHPKIESAGMDVSTPHPYLKIDGKRVKRKVVLDNYFRVFERLGPNLIERIGMHTTKQNQSVCYDKKSYKRTFVFKGYQEIPEWVMRSFVDNPSDTPAKEVSCHLDGDTVKCPGQWLNVKFECTATCDSPVTDLQ